MTSAEEVPSYHTQPFLKLWNGNNQEALAMSKLVLFWVSYAAFEWVWDIHQFIPYSQCVLIAAASTLIYFQWQWFKIRENSFNVSIALRNDALLLQREGSEPLSVEFNEEAAQFREQQSVTVLKTPHGTYALPTDHPTFIELRRRYPTLPWAPLSLPRGKVTVFVLTIALWSILSSAWVIREL